VFSAVSSLQCFKFLVSKSFLNFHTVESLKGALGFAVDSYRCALGEMNSVTTVGLCSLCCGIKYFVYL
jgi:hypothetical protein